jgi:hypothetical protein
MNETVFRPTAVFDETVTICVAIAIDPLKRALDVRPNRLDKSAVTPCACNMRLPASQKVRRRVRCSRSSVLNGILSQNGHFIIAGFMQHLARVARLVRVLSVA